MKLNAEQQKLVEDNINLVYYTINKYFYMNFGNIDVNDLVGEGMLCLCKCAYYFDPDRGVKFSTYSVRSLKKNLTVYLRNYFDKNFILEEDLVLYEGKYYDEYSFEIREEVEEFLKKYLKNEKDVQILMMYFFDNKSTKEISKELGYKNQECVNAKKQYILRKLGSNKDFKNKYLEYFI